MLWVGVILVRGYMALRRRYGGFRGQLYARFVGDFYSYSLISSNIPKNAVHRGSGGTKLASIPISIFCRAFAARDPTIILARMAEI